MKCFYFFFKTFLCGLAFIFISEMMQAQTIYYVTQNGAGNQSGSSWSNAAPGTQLQNKINAASSGSQVWVAAGTYKPNTYPNGCPNCGTDIRNYTFELKNNLKIYGGFAGTETTLGQRNLSVNHSVLSGDIGITGNNTDNCYHVVLSVNNDNTAILEGFTITGGYANSTGNIYAFFNIYISNSIGAGMYINLSNPLVINCIFCANSVPVLNSVPSGGGAVYIGNSSATTISNCLFYSNTTVSDGTITLYEDSSSLSIINCTFSGNTADNVISNYYSSPTISNCVMWNNTLSGPSVFSPTNSATLITYSDIEGGYNGTGNLNTDPLFVNTTSNDYHIQSNSPVKDKGNNLLNNTSADLDNKTRIDNGIIDMGAYELQCTPPTLITSQPKNTFACIGSTATFTVAVSGVNLIYMWHKGSTTITNNSPTLTLNNVQPADAGSYTVDVIGNCSTVTSTSASLTVGTAPSITTQPQDEAVCAGSSATFSVSVSGNVLNFTWEYSTDGGITWTNTMAPSASQITFNNVPVSVNGNKIRVVITNNCGIVTSNPVTFTVNTAPAITTQPAAATQCFGGAVTFSAAATGVNLTYQWKKGSTSITGATSNTYGINTVSAGDAGSYSVVVTGDCGTVTSNTATLTVNSVSTPAVSVTDDCGSSTLSTTATGTLLWSTGETTSSITVSNAGNYSVTQTVNGCTSAAGLGTASPNAIPLAPVVYVTNHCGSSTLYITATRNLLWSTGETTSSITVSNAGNYTVTQTVNGCTSSQGSGTAAPNAIPATPMVTVTNNCGSSTLSTTATGSLLWSTGETTSSIAVSSAGNYTVTQTVNGCTSSQGSGTAAPNAIPATPVVTVTNNCGSSTLSTTATGSLLWSTGETTSSIAVTNAGNYSVTQTINGCTSAAGSGTAVPNAIPSTPMVSVTNNCGSSTLLTIATGTLLWSTGETTSSINVTTPENYTVTQSVNGCTSAAGSGTAAPKSIPSTPAVAVSVNCGSSTLSTTATGTLLWSTGETTSSINVTTDGSYTVTQTVNGCTSATGSGTAAPKAIPSTPAVAVSDNCGSSTLSTTATGTLLWSTGATTSSIVVTTAGTYSVTQTVNGCTSLQGYGVASPKTAPTAPVVTVTNNCGSSTLSTTATGSLLWSTGATTSSIVVTTAGTYSVTQTVGGCSSLQGSGVASPKTAPAAPVVTVTNSCGSSTLSTTTTGTLLWNTGATTSSIMVTTAGNYSVTQTVGGCTSVAGSAIASPKTAPAPPVVTVVNKCGSSTLSTTATGSLLWSTGATTSSISVTTAGTYSVTQTVNGCTSASGIGTAAPNKPAGLVLTAIITTASANMCSTLIPFASYVNMSGNPNPSAIYKIGNKVITSPYAFPIGITTVTVTATNTCGFSAGLLLVTVIDNQKPVITCKPSVTKTVSGSNYTVAGAEFNATATDNCGTPSLIYSLSGATTAAYKSTNTTLAGVKLNIGTTTITWKATDASGNISTCTTVVKVVKSTLSNGSGNDNLITSTAEQALKLEVKVFPNPSSYYFTLQLKSKSLEKCKLVVLDAVGRTIEQQNNISPNSTLKIGGTYRPGTYIGVILQGNDKISLMLIKEGN